MLASRQRAPAPVEAAVWIATRLQLGSEGVRTVGPTREGDMGARVLLLAILGMVLLAACAGGEQAHEDDRRAGGPTRAPTPAERNPVPAETPQRPITLEGRGIQDTRSFTTTASAWRMCIRLWTRFEEVDTHFTVRTDPRERVEGRLSFLAGEDEEQCTVVRTQPGRYFVRAVGGDAAWTITIGPP